MSLGSELQNARELRKITLEAISKKTRIPVKYLEAIEEDNFGIFPSHTYAKGFIRAYAKVVGLDAQVLTRQFNAEVIPEDVKIEPKNAEMDLEKNLGWRPTLTRPPVFRKPDGDANLNLEIVEEGYQEPIRHEPSVMRQRARSLRKMKVGQWVGQVMVALGLLILVTVTFSFVKKGLSKINWSGPKMEAGTGEAKGYEPVKIKDKYQHLVLKALDKSWVLVTMDDGQSSSEADLDQGEVKTYQAVKNFTLKLGNAGGVDVQFNGKPLGVLGVAGQVVEIQLPQPNETKAADSNS